VGGGKSMKISYYRNLNNTEKYVTNKKQLKYNLLNTDELSICFGLTRQFEFDSRCPNANRPIIKGIVIATASYQRDRTIGIYFFPITRNTYPEKAYKEFNNSILPNIKKWIQEQTTKPDTAILGIEELIIEWNGKNHLLHNVRFL
jgi:hypothetical protein